MEDGLKWIAVDLLAGVLVLTFMYLFIQWREMSEATRIQENQRNLRQATVDYLNDILPLHSRDCEADTIIWSAVSSARERVNGMFAVLDYDVSPEVIVASIEAGAQLTHAYDVAYWACKGQAR